MASFEKMVRMNVCSSERIFVSMKDTTWLVTLPSLEMILFISLY